MMSTNRRDWIRSVGAMAGLGPAWGALARADGEGRGKPPTILVRSSWQTVNIGDIAHTPGLLRLLGDAFPDAELVLWPSSLDRGVGPMLRKRFPKLKVLKGSKGVEPRDDDPTRAEAFARADLMIHGSGPSVLAARDLEAWRDETGKPYGIIGVTIENATPIRSLLEGASFVFTRETRSLDHLREQGLSGPRFGFAADATLATDLRDDAAADALLKRLGLKPGAFLCVVPRLRYTPYWEIHPERSRDEKIIRERTAVNDEHVEADHAKLREAAVAWSRHTGGTVLAVPEMTYQVDMLGPMIVDRLPSDVKARAVALDRYWLTDEATSVYAKAAAVLSFECHSPLLALACGTPAMHVRQPTDTWKGQMYDDLGLWSAEVDRASGDDLAAMLVGIAEGPEATRQKLNQGLARARDSHERAMTAARRALPARS
jgi:hypothetical protein